MSRSKPVKKESESKQLRSVFFVLFEQDDEGFEEFESYYECKMNKLIKHYKKLIDKDGQ